VTQGSVSYRASSLDLRQRIIGRQDRFSWNTTSPAMVDHPHPDLSIPFLARQPNGYAGPCRRPADKGKRKHVVLCLVESQPIKTERASHTQQTELIASGQRGNLDPRHSHKFSIRVQACFSSYLYILSLKALQSFTPYMVVVRISLSNFRIPFHKCDTNQPDRKPFLNHTRSVLKAEMKGNGILEVSPPVPFSSG